MATCMFLSQIITNGFFGFDININSIIKNTVLIGNVKKAIQIKDHITIKTI